MQNKKIFLASSAELKEDRVAFELMIGRLNQEWVSKGYFFHVVVWENFIDAMSKDGLQQEYNKAITESDIFVLLFFTKVGKYTAEEFETAFGAFRDGNKPLIYTYFKDDLVLTGDIDESIVSMLDFKKKLSDLKHYYTRYSSVEELKWKFSRQLDKLYGDVQTQSLDITSSTPQSQIDTIALTLSNRFLSDVDARTTVDPAKLHDAILRAGDLTRHTIFLLAEQIRRDNWAGNKSLMARTILIFEALIESDPHRHFYYGQLGYALKDKDDPDWKRAKQALDQAIELRGAHERGYWAYYEFNRAVCSINLDPHYTDSQASTAAVKKSILADIKVAKRGLRYFDRLIEQPQNLPVKKWMQINKVQPD